MAALVELILDFTSKHSESGALEVGLVAGGDCGQGRDGVGTLEGEAGRQRGDGGARDGPWRGSDEREERWGRPRRRHLTFAAQPEKVGAGHGRSGLEPAEVDEPRPASSGEVGRRTERVCEL